jgi:peptide/nickel transport system substrate-binding protein
MRVDLAAIDVGTLVTRWTQKSPPGQGGWQVVHINRPSMDCATPATDRAVRASGDGAFFG